MKLVATIIKPVDTFGLKVFHVRLAKDRQRFLHESITERHIGPRPWSEIFWVDETGHIHEVFARH